MNRQIQLRAGRRGRWPPRREVKGKMEEKLDLEEWERQMEQLGEVLRGEKDAEEYIRTYELQPEKAEQLREVLRQEAQRKAQERKNDLETAVAALFLALVGFGFGILFHALFYA